MFFSLWTHKVKNKENQLLSVKTEIRKGLFQTCSYLCWEISCGICLEGPTPVNFQKNNKFFYAVIAAKHVLDFRF